MQLISSAVDDVIQELIVRSLGMGFPDFTDYRVELLEWLATHPI